MSQNYFSTCETIDEVKAAYMELAKENQADQAAMTAINAEYFEALEANDGKAIIGDDEKPHTYQLNDDHEQAIVEKIAALLSLDLPEEAKVMLIGKWIWITGIDRKDKATHAAIKTEGLKFHGKRLAWFWKPYAVYFGRRNHNATSTDDIAARYGSQHFIRQAVAA